MQERVVFKNSKGDNLVGILSNPADSADVPIVILCHGFSSFKESKTYQDWQKDFNEKRVATLRFDFYGHGESDGRFEDITISEAVDDAENAIDFLKEKGYSKIAYVGSSFGGQVGIVLASNHPELFALALKSPVSNYMEKTLLQKERYRHEEWKEKGFIIYSSHDGRKSKLNYSFYEDAIRLNGYESAKKIDIPTLIVHGSADKIVPLEQSKKTAGLISDCELEIINNADHFYSEPEHYKECRGKVVDFVVKHSLED